MFIQIYLKKQNQDIFSKRLVATPKSLHFNVVDFNLDEKSALCVLDTNIINMTFINLSSINKTRVVVSFAFYKKSFLIRLNRPTGITQILYLLLDVKSRNKILPF